jgi:hypothetical protein
LPEAEWAATALINAGLTYGSLVPVSWLEKVLGVKRSERFMQFSLAVSVLRQALERHGLHADGPGAVRDWMEIIQANANVDVATSYARQAKALLGRSVVLLSRTDMSQLTEPERVKHERLTEKLAARLALSGRHDPIKDVKALEGAKNLRNGQGACALDFYRSRMDEKSEDRS